MSSGWRISASVSTSAAPRVTATPDGGALVTFRITNTGKRSGVEIAQVYVEPPAGTLPRAVRELKGFIRVALAPGETKLISVTLDHSAFTYFDEKSGTWKSASGPHGIAIGASSRDLRLNASVELK